MEKIHEILKIPEPAYGSMIWAYWWKYCGHINGKNGPENFQNLIADTALFNYFLANYRKLEQEFLEEYKAYEDTRVSTDDAITLYHKNVYKIEKYYYSHTLIAAARSKTIINECTK